MEKLPKMYVCMECVGLRNHFLVSEIFTTKQTSDTDKEIIVNRVIRCCGCETVSYLTEYRDEKDEVLRFEIFPPREELVVKAKQLKNTDERLKRLYNRMVKNFNDQGGELDCGGNLRQLVEGICLKLGIVKGKVPKADGKVNTQKDLEGKIFGLAENGILHPKIAETLHQIRFLGNESVHDLDPASREELHLGIRIIENVIDSIFEIVPVGQELDTKRNARQVILGKPTRARAR